ncbi:MAG TPA: alpha/beta fold hydrolase [Allosphingosinicella sp.]
MAIESSPSGNQMHREVVVRLRKKSLLCAQVAAAVILHGCASVDKPPRPSEVLAPATRVFTDPSRGRQIPVLLYGLSHRAKPLVLISHGYGGRNTAYSFIANHLAGQGYLVASVQHELSGDPELPTTGVPSVVRRPSWEQGVRNLKFVIEALRKQRAASNDRIILVGHSHGGDMSALFVEQHPRLVQAVFSLDNRRMRLPRTSRPRICSVRSTDQTADEGVLPTPAEVLQHRMVIATVPDLKHNDMWDGANPAQKQSVLGVLDRCLR